MNQGRLRSRIRAVLTSAAILLPALAVTATTPITASASTTRMIASGGTTVFNPAASAVDTGGQGPEIRPSTESPAGPAGPNVVATSAGAEGTGDGGRTAAQQSLTFQGLFHRQQRLANGGNQFSVEPPDQGLCAGNGFVLETVNDVMRVFDTAGNPVTGVQDLNSFYGYIPAINRTTGVFGPFVTDPTCLYDAATHRFFLVVLTLSWALMDRQRVWRPFMLLASYVFYAWWDWRFVFLLAASTVLNHVLALAIHRSKALPVRKAFLALAVAFAK